MTSDSDQILRDYVERLLLLDDEQDDWLGEADLKDVARDLGLSEEDLARLEEITEGHQRRGLHFAEGRAWDEAIEEFRQAVVLAPFDVALLQDIAAAHASRWQGSGRSEDRDAAERYARRCIELDANHQASYDLLTTLRPFAGQGGGRVKRLAAGIVVAGLAVVASLMVLRSATTPEPETGAPVAEALTDAGANPSSGESEVPVRLVGADDLRGLSLDVQRSRLHVYDSAFSYTLYATLSNETAELHRLRMRMSLIDPDGEELQTEYFDVRADHQPYLRPGETAPISELIYEERSAPTIDHIRLSVDIVEREPAASSYEEAIPLPVEWPFDQPAHLEIDISERDSRVTEGLSGRLHFLTLRSHNRGTRSLQRLILQVTWFDASDAAITSERVYMILASGPSMRAGQMWVANVIGRFPAGDGSPFARYVVSVVEAD